MAKQEFVSYIFPNGDRYEGSCSRSESGAVWRSGKGKQTMACGIIYEGEWYEDKMSGQGTLVYPSGAVYEGQLKDNMYHGTGSYLFPDGSMYIGPFCENKLEGEGEFKNAQGVVWTGQFHGTSAPGLSLQYKKIEKQKIPI